MSLSYFYFKIRGKPKGHLHDFTAFILKVSKYLKLDFLYVCFKQGLLSLHLTSNVEK